MATLRSQVKVLRESILDNLGGQGVDWETILEQDVASAQLRWSNEELTLFIDQALKQVYRRIHPVELYEPEFDIGVVAGTHTYDLDTRILRVEGAKLQVLKKDLRPIDHQDLWRRYSDWESETGQPEGYLVDYDVGRIRLWPIPVAIDTLQLFVTRLPLKKLSWKAPDMQVELREEWLYPMLFYAAHLAYLKDETSTYDPNKSNSFLVRFEQEFPHTSANSDVMKARTTRRTIKYGGIPQGPFRYRSRYRNEYDRWP